MHLKFCALGEPATGQRMYDTHCEEAPPPSTCGKAVSVAPLQIYVSSSAEGWWIKLMTFGVGENAGEVEHIRALEKEKGLTPDWDINSYMTVSCPAYSLCLLAGLRLGHRT